MPYTGEVTKGGPADVRTLPSLTISKVSVGDFDNNAYLLRCTSSGEQLLIDAANDSHTLLDLIGNRPLSTIVTTHRHQDHWNALRAVAEATHATTVAHRFDVEALPIPVTRVVDHEDKISFGEIELDVIHLRGHTPGSIALLYSGADAPQLFTGDSLFPGGVGNTWGDKKLFHQLIDDVEERVFGPLPDNTWVYPGHGSDTTLGKERPHIPAWREREW